MSESFYLYYLISIQKKYKGGKKIMANVEFNDYGYKYYNESNRFLFSSDAKHENLFDFVSSNLSDSPELFQTYISKKLDIITFEPKNCKNNDNDIIKIKELLVSCHPYYEYEYQRVMIKTIGEYFNNLLVHSVIQNQTILHNSLQRNWFCKRFNWLIPDFLTSNKGITFNGEIPEKYFYSEYLKRIGSERQKQDENIIYDVPQESLVGFVDQIRAQKMAYNMLYFILDISAPKLEGLTKLQRIWVFENIFQAGYYQSEIKIMKKPLFQYTFKWKDDNDYSTKHDNYVKTYDLFKPLHNLSKLDAGYTSIPANMTEFFNDAIEQAKSITPSKIYEEYEINSIYQLLYLEIVSMINSDTMIRKCKNCGKYFVITNRKIAYCDRIDESGSYCSAVGSKRSFQKKMEQEEELKIYNRAYKTHHARVRNKIMSTADFDDWVLNAKKKLEQVRSGELDISTYQKWLKK